MTLFFFWKKRIFLSLQFKSQIKQNVLNTDLKKKIIHTPNDHALRKTIPKPPSPPKYLGHPMIFFFFFLIIF